MSADDLAPFLRPAAEPGPSQNVRYRQGTIVSFDPVTLANTVDVGGTQFTNLPLLGVSDARTLVPDAKVGLLVIESTLGTTSYAINGRFVTPNTPAAAAAVSLLSATTRTATVPTSESTSSSSYTDLTTPGPILSGVTVGPSGRCLVTVGAEIQASASSGSVVQTGAGFMSYEVAGATAVAAADSRAAQLWVAYDNGAAVFATTINGRSGASRTTLLEGLTPGLHTFKALYKRNGAAAATFVERNLTVILL